MAGHETLAQSCREGIEVEAAIKLAKRRSADVGASTATADRVTGPAHPLGQCTTMLLGRGR
jgi:hypothetical protein